MLIMFYRRKVPDKNHRNFCFKVILICRFVSAICSESTSSPTINCPEFVVERGSLSCECEVPLKLSSEKVSLFWRDQTERSPTLRKNVSRHDNGTVYTCEMNWEGQTTTEDYTLRVVYGPDNVTISGPSPFVTNGSQSVTLTCQVTNCYPEPALFWGNINCESSSPAGLCTFTPRIGKDDGLNISCTASSKSFTTLPISATASFSLNQMYPPQLPPKLLTRRNQSLTTVDIVTCSAKGGKPLVEEIKLSCSDMTNSSYSIDPPGSDHHGLVSSSLAFPLVQSQVVVCTCRGVWSPQEDMYPHVVTATYSFKEYNADDFHLEILLGSLSFLATVAVVGFCTVLCKRMRTGSSKDKESLHNESDGCSDANNEETFSDLKETSRSKPLVNQCEMATENAAWNSSSNLYPNTSDSEGCQTKHSSNVALVTETRVQVEAPSVKVDHSETGVTPCQTACPAPDRNLIRAVENPDSETHPSLYFSLDSNELMHARRDRPTNQALPYCVVDICQHPNDQQLNIDFREHTASQNVDKLSSIKKESVGADRKKVVSEKTVRAVSEASEYNVLRVSHAKSSQSSDYETPPVVGGSGQANESYSNLWRESQARRHGHKVESGDVTVVSNHRPSLRPAIIDVISCEGEETHYENPVTLCAEYFIEDPDATKGETQANAYDEIEYKRVSICAQEVKVSKVNDSEVKVSVHYFSTWH